MVVNCPGPLPVTDPLSEYDNTQSRRECKAWMTPFDKYVGPGPNTLCPTTC
jgi:hypothetical protein